MTNFTPKKCKQIALARLDIVHKWLEFRNKSQNKLQADYDFVKLHNTSNSHLFEILGEINALDDLMLATEVKTIQRNGIRFLNCDYFDERLYGFKSKVLIKYNLFDLTSIKVYTPKGEYLCTAERVTETHPMAKLLGDVKDFEDYKQKIVKQRQLKKKTVESVKKYLETEDIKILETKTGEPTVQAVFKSCSNGVYKSFKNNADKYEYLIIHNPQDVLTGMTSIILFLYEKNKIINKLYNNFAEIYFTLCVIDKNLGNFLIKKEITDMNFRINYKLTMEIINTIKEFDFDEYTSFFDSKFNSLLEQFLSFNLKLYNLHNIVGERNQGVLYHELTLKDLELKRLQGIAEQMLLTCNLFQT